MSVTSSGATPAPAYINLDAAAAYLGLSPVTLRRAISAGELRGFKFGPQKGLRVRFSDLDRWAETKAIPNARTAARRRSA